MGVKHDIYLQAVGNVEWNYSSNLSSPQYPADTTQNAYAN